MNVLFDLMIPPKYDKDKEELLKYISGKVKEKDRHYICVIKLEQDKKVRDIYYLLLYNDTRCI